MTVSEMHTAFDLQLERIASNAYDDFLPEEVDMYLNRAVGDFVDLRRDVLIGEDWSIPPDPLVAKANEELRPLLNTVSVTSIAIQDHPVYGSLGVSQVLLSAFSEYRYYIRARLKTADTNGWKNARLVGPQEFLNYLPSLTNSPIFRDVPVSLEGSYILFIRNPIDAAPSLFSMTYIRNPATILLDTSGGGAGNVDCDLPAFTHQQIINAAVALALGDLSHNPMRPVQVES